MNRFSLKNLNQKIEELLVRIEKWNVTNSTEELEEKARAKGELQIIKSFIGDIKVQNLKTKESIVRYCHEQRSKLGFNSNSGSHQVKGHGIARNEAYGQFSAYDIIRNIITSWKFG